MYCIGCKYNRDLSLEDVMFCLDCKRAYKKDTDQHKNLKDKYTQVNKSIFKKKAITMAEKQAKMADFCGTLIITCIMTLALCNTWERLEQMIYGTIENRVVDNIIMIPIILSFWFNAKYLVRSITSDKQ